ncbi:hypothetical protein HQN89_22600 [Paenibacillus frigoriresistens]|nr:hypothetical protein [Paenibacillus frigoriresistens]
MCAQDLRGTRQHEDFDYFDYSNFIYQILS